ncbi:MAG: hypothetical protein H6712_34700 [Myxococcales bacterium]|nr:hypothetical protein [Myxococcales bacterium]MCB9719047.1 hypothetical protein [Myxococcales bacterium]
MADDSLERFGIACAGMIACGPMAGDPADGSGSGYPLTGTPPDHSR